MRSTDSIAKDKVVAGFSRLSKIDKINWLVRTFMLPGKSAEALTAFWHPQNEQQKIFDEFAENTLTNYYLPFGVAPNFLINGKVHCVPMVIEESSVVAAASKAAKFWLDRGGFHSEILGTQKVGTVYFNSKASLEKINQVFASNELKLREYVNALTVNMEKRGGGIGALKILAVDLPSGPYKLQVNFETCDAMGANFINSVLEAFADYMRHNWPSQLEDSSFAIVMSILSNYTPECLVRTRVSCPIEKLGDFPGSLGPREFAEKFKLAVDIARLDTYRATTHNKGIMNGIDAVVLATGNDFRAVEACAHAYAGRDGTYRSLSECSIDNDQFNFELSIPLAMGTVGGLTSLHPLAKVSLEILGNPSARELMQVASAVGLSQNFAAIKSLITTGIQMGHMKMHLLNILRSFAATDSEIESAKKYFQTNKVSFSAVREFLNTLRDYH